MAHTLYENFVLEHKIETTLNTLLDLNQFLTQNASLVASPGMKIKIDKKTGAGKAQDLAQGEGNTESITVTSTPTEYEVKVTQAHFQYFDEEEMKDPLVVDAGTQYLSEAMVNDFNAKAVAEFEKATLKQEYTAADGIKFEDVVDAVAQLNSEQEQQLFGLLNVKTIAKLRKNLKDDLKYVEAFVRTGYVGTVNGVSLYTSKAVKDDEMIIATREAVTAFTKRGTEVEQKRNPDKRQNDIYARKVAVVALTDATKVVLIAPQDP